jgi:hypothetical protein
MAKKDKDKAGGGKGGKPALTVSISAHPRAKAGIRRARTRAALIAFALVLALNVMGDQDLFDAVWRALLAGIVSNVVVWRFAIVVWRHIVIGEVRQLEEELAEKLRVQREERERIAAEQRARAI